MIFDEKPCCGNCKWRQYDIIDGWVCVNDQSDFCTDWTDYDWCCDEWEERRKK